MAERHEALRDRVRAYLDGPYRSLPAGRYLGPRLGGATILGVGAHALGAGSSALPTEVEVFLAEEEWVRLRAEARASDLLTLDPETGYEVRVRDTLWLGRRLEDPEGLWLRQRAAVVQDPTDRLGPAVRGALSAFRSAAGGHALARYRAFREGFETADAALDPSGRSALLGRAVEAALALPILARGEPWPPPRWLGWYLSAVDPEGERMVALCARAAGGPAVEREAYGALRRLIDDTLDRAGYGESLVRAYRALA